MTEQTEKKLYYPIISRIILKSRRIIKEAKLPRSYDKK